MLIPHRGKGIFVPVIGIIAAVSMNAFSFKLFGGDYYQRNVWPKVGSLWLAALCCFILGTYLKKHPSVDKFERQRTPHSLTFDPKLDLFEKGAKLEPKDHLCFVPVAYWGAIYFLIGVVYAVMKLLGRG